MGDGSRAVSKNPLHQESSNANDSLVHGSSIRRTCFFMGVKDYEGSRVSIGNPIPLVNRFVGSISNVAGAVL